MRTDTIQKRLRPLSEQPLQAFLGTGIHTLGLLGWILQQVGRADVYVSTYSTSEEFLSGFHNLQKKGLIAHSVLLADLKASRKTVKLSALMSRCFDQVYLGQNHSKVVLVQTDKGRCISVISSQNQTYGGRAECTMISTSQEIFMDLYCGFKDIVKQSVLLDGLFPGPTTEDRAVSSHSHSCLGDLRPFGVEE